MAVGRREASDRTFEKSAEIFINRHKFDHQTVYGDGNAPRRRDIFVPDEALERFDELPKTATVHWNGYTYTARLTFRTVTGGQSIPVYSFTVEG